MRATPWNKCFLAVICLAAFAVHALAGAAAEGDAAAIQLLQGAEICAKGPSPLCCGMLDKVLGDPESPVTRWGARSLFLSPKVFESPFCFVPKQRN